ncbi:MAG: DsrE family protein [Gammaproteobacteria bacterium]|nr:DsrE family protein [Gammaproteobacteria bacterium]
MRSSHWLLAGALAAFAFQARAADGFAHWHTLHIQVPVVLKQAKVVFNMDHLAFVPHTREPVGLSQMRMMVAKFTRDHTHWKIDGIFQGAAGYMVLNNKAYDRFMHVRTGNPYTGQIEKLIHQGVDIEACGVTMRAYHWGNRQLLPHVKVNAGALARIIQLVQRGYVQIQP